MFTDPPDNVDDLFSCYDRVLRQLVDKHVPLRSVVIRQRPQSPWYDGESWDEADYSAARASLQENSR